jgi:hypothetical protein
MGLVNTAVFVVSTIVGYLLGHFLPGAWAIFVSLLVSYHLFLAWLVFSADHETGFSLPIGSTILTHLACLMVLIGIGIGRHYVPLFGLIRYFIPALAPFECTWLFSGGRKKEVTANDLATSPIINTSAQDHEEWLSYVARQRPPFPRPGTSLKAEYERWLLARAQARRTAPSNDNRA